MGAKGLVTVAGLALLDSLNISLILGTVHLMLSNKRPIPKVLVFAGVFYAVYVAAGVIQLGVGVLLFLYGIFAKTERREIPVATSYPATVGLACTVAAVEVVTALPYLAAISVVSQSGLGFPARVLVLLGYNLRRETKSEAERPEEPAAVVHRGGLLHHR
ncbi:hypothetical protein [Amycolatopsis tolypomycina]|uniref:hypothetical protein n=1 Tax=Amycolatopsis tolypomycina TaxID=208445 RepID=UPI0033B9A148